MFGVTLEATGPCGRNDPKNALLKLKTLKSSGNNKKYRRYTYIHNNP